MVIRVGIVGRRSGWGMLLEQEGVPYAQVTEPPAPDTWSALVVSDGEEKVDAVREYLAGGGAVLCSADTYGRIANLPCQRGFIRYLTEESDSLFAGVSLLDLFGECTLARDASALRTDRGKPAVFVGEFGRGQIVALPFDAGKMIRDPRTGTKSFYAEHKRLPFETVSLVSRNGIRRLVARSLEILHHRRGLPYAHAWYYPSDTRTLFAFRVDTDGAERRDIEQLYSLSRLHGIPFTWFVDVGSQKDSLSFFKAMERQEIGVHCYDHRPHEQYESTLADVRLAVRAFRGHGIEAPGYAAPYGTWNEAIARVVSECRFEYSSEFSCDYDNLPSSPPVQDPAARSLQVPVHPISIGNLRRQGIPENDMRLYFLRIIEQKLDSREPIFLYHHPKNGHAGVLEEIFNFVRTRGVHSTRMIDYARWWKRRCSANFELHCERSTISARFPDPPPDVPLHITRIDDTEAFAPVQSSIDLDRLTWMPKPEAPFPPPDIHRIRRFNPWIPVIRAGNMLSRWSGA